MAKKIHHMIVKKAGEIKDLIAKKTKYSDIVESKFQGNIEKKNDWLDKAKELFTDEELAFLEYNLKIEFPTEEKKEEIEQKKEEKKEEKIIEDIPKETEREVTGLEERLAQTESDLEAIKKLLTPRVIEVLELAEKDVNRSIDEELKRVKIPAKYNTKNAVTKSFRLDKELYEKFSKFCYDNDIQIKSCINYLLDMFLSKNEEQE